MGVVLAFALHTIYGSDKPVILKILYSGLTLLVTAMFNCLQMIVMPLAVFASILSAVARLHNASQLGKNQFLTIGTLCLPR